MLPGIGTACRPCPLQRPLEWCGPMKSLITFLKDESGPTAVEYAVMLGLIIMTAILAISSMGQQVGTLFSNADAEMQAHGIK